MDEQTQDIYSLILVSVERRHVQRAYEEMKKLPQVGFAITVTGNADIALMARTKSTKDLGNLVFEIIHEINGVINTSTYVDLSEFEPKFWPMYVEK